LLLFISHVANRLAVAQRRRPWHHNRSPKTE
jgi:hypothetical protein